MRPKVGYLFRRFVDVETDTAIGGNSCFAADHPLPGHRHGVPCELTQQDLLVRDVRPSVFGCLGGQHADEIFWIPPLGHVLLEVGERLGVEDRDHVGQEKRIEPNRLVHAQRPQRHDCQRLRSCANAVAATASVVGRRTKHGSTLCAHDFDS